MKITHRVLAFKTKSAATQFAIKKWVELAKSSIEKRGRFTVALSGGSTPEDFYLKLGMQNNLPWNKTYLFQVDERFVPFDDRASNFRMIKESLIQNIDIPKANIHSINTAEENPDISAAKYEAELQSFFVLQPEQFPVFDLIMLGIGEEGHTASLFPGTPAISEKKHLAIAVNVAGIEHKRITVTLPLINNARKIIFLVTGKNKSYIIKEILERHNKQLPAALIRPTSGELFFVLGECYG